MHVVLGRESKKINVEGISISSHERDDFLPRGLAFVSMIDAMGPFVTFLLEAW